MPIRRWLINIVLFFGINLLNNHAFSYDISVPVHIILRSGGSITTIVAGSLYGKKYSRIQVTAVVLLTMVRRTGQGSLPLAPITFLQRSHHVYTNAISSNPQLTRLTNCRRLASVQVS